MATLALLALSMLGAGPPADPHAFVIRRARVFDGQRLLSARDVWVESGRSARSAHDFGHGPEQERSTAQGRPT
jgi:hypothetical protein